MSEIVYPKKLNAVIDVTKPPFSAIPDGKTDCTKALCAAFDYIANSYLNAFNEAKQRLEGLPDDNALISFEIRKADGLLNVPFPEVMPNGYILYFPRGTYLVSDTITYSLENLYNILFSTRWLEMNALFRIVGQDRNNTTIRLADGAPGFGFGARKPVISFMNGEKSGVAMTNALKNITISAGKNNPGAVGIRFFSNNSGLVEHVRIISEDADLRGYAGLEIVDEKVSGSYIRDLEVTGFDYAVRVTPQQHYTVFEHIRISKQHIAGIYHAGTVLSLRDLQSDNTVTAVFTVGFTAQLILVDSVFTGGNPTLAAVSVEYGFCYIRNIKAKGYGFPLRGYFDKFTYDTMPYEYSSHGYQCLWDDAPAPAFFDTADMPDPPEFSTDYTTFASVADFGAVGDGKADDTDAIQRALDSGATGIYFTTGRFLITRPLRIGAQVSVVDFMYCDLRISDALALSEDKSVFQISEGTEPLQLCNLFGWEQLHGLLPLIEQQGTRTLLLNSLHTQALALYRNTVGGGLVFIQNCACTIGGIPGAGGREQPLSNEEKMLSARHIPGFHFHNQTVYARQLNPERSLTEVVNDGGQLTVLGFKTEEEGTAFYTLNGGVAQILGGTCCIGLNKQLPLIRLENSHTFCVLSTMITNTQQLFPCAVSDTRGEECRTISDSELPKRAMLSYVIPRYIG